MTLLDPDHVATTTTAQLVWILARRLLEPDDVAPTRE
jgi:hypothetical protein